MSNTETPPQAYLVKLGPVDLPLGDPLRITHLELAPSLDAAEQIGRECSFDWRGYEVRPVDTKGKA